MADDTVKLTDPAPEPSDELKDRIAALKGEEDATYKTGEITADTDDSVAAGNGGIRHFDGTVVKIDGEGNRVLSGFVDPALGERLAGEVDDESPDSDSDEDKGSEADAKPNTSTGASSSTGTASGTPAKDDNTPAVITSLPK